MTVSLSIFKEPRGLIRIIQAVLAIFAFSTTAAFSATISFIIKCNDEKNSETISYKFGYPFSIRETPLLAKDCNGSTNLTLPYVFSGSAEFFVATGVIAFLYTIVICVVYTIGQESYQNNPLFPLVDMGVTSVISLFWLAGSSAWADSVSDLKYYMRPSNIYPFLCDCQHNTHDCEEDKVGGFATLDISLVFGFANFLLWLASIWFVYKETSFHQQQQQHGEANATGKA